MIGQKIQGNVYKVEKYDFLVFNVFDITTRKYYSYKDLVAFCEKHGFKTVPIIRKRLYVLVETVPEMLKFAEGKSQLNKKVEREGVVVRNYGMNTSFKAVSNKFLLQHENK